ncbi:MAG: DUF4266 domain-containing protein [Epsilonproteobacteria bacterium]|nr:DUF4266 domain-containing protein [Campylobacterota bacterium]OIO17975.1 MAG: hypothetical protein AUJ81_00420 [Helicobacteraceae bacterium CG1_02_36_14]PIP09984.1 MAG: hypothetical protein COX50_08070 [Sulfurimonas sp. CG23_combo_of_CG06-09_8_20_14_all_36_33]PIS25223.1 MAG: hypothetical protein COT46_06675 [Sulfurimonas sp. CG08_land_8_20_14_0_20_36_33]PIU35357.1 MAG: hypothetical protein COT05_03730 [Sulfurimonas sp. CG07_land_8_20_14_0_80_36_56]PIV05174.1 MAG: hypothetical protein COS56_
MQYLVLIALLLLSGCSERLVRVMPYEKEYFAQDKMRLSPVDARAEQEGHIFLIREASAGGDSSFQGGCGCR